VTLNIKMALRATAIAAGLLAASQANAVDWGGYFRSGPGATSTKDTARQCYGLNGAGLKYRLGNECDFYGEFALSQGFKADGVDVKATLMTNLYNGATDTGDAKLGINQMYFQGTGFDIAPNVTFWAGKRFYGRADVHIVDTFFVNLSGVGAGVDDINIGAGKLNIAWFKDDNTSAATTYALNSGTGVLSSTTTSVSMPTNRLNLDLHDIGINPGGKLRVVLTLAHGDFTDGKSGAGLTLQHNQDFGGGFSNTLWVQVAQDAAALNGTAVATKVSGKGFRIVESPAWQMGALGGQAIALYEQDKDANGVKTANMSLGGRVSYGLTKNFKLVGELGLSSTKTDGSDKQTMTKFTFAPTLSTGPDFWTRPELRLYVTAANWNDATKVAQGLTKTSGVSYGAQVEWWF